MNNKDKQEIGKRIDKIRISMGLSKEDFAKLLGVTGQHLGNVITGKVGLSIDKLICLCKKTNKSADYYLFGSENTIKDLTETLLSNYSVEEIQIFSKVVNSLSKAI